MDSTNRPSSSGYRAPPAQGVGSGSKVAPVVVPQAGQGVPAFNDPARQPDAAPSRDSKAAPRAAQALSAAGATLTPEYLAFRLAARGSYPQFLKAANEFSADLATGSKSPQMLKSSFNTFYETYLGDAAPYPAALPSNLREGVKKAWIIVSDAGRGVGRPLSEQERAAVLQAIQSAKDYASHVLDETTVLNKFGRVSQDDADERRQKLRKVVEDPRESAQLTKFQKHCSKEVSTENLDFLRSMSLARHAPDSMRLQAYQDIQRQFIGPKAERSVNISRALAKSVTSAVAPPPMPSPLAQPAAEEAADAGKDQLAKADQQMEQAYDEVLTLVKQDTFKRFAG